MRCVAVVCRVAVCCSAGGPEDASEENQDNDGDNHERGSDIH